MPKNVVLVGHCGPDSSYLRMAIRSADPQAHVLTAANEQTLHRHLKQGADLILFNRLVNSGFEETEGVAIIRRLKREHPELRMMMVSNYSDAQHAAQKAGALPGFGKDELGSARVAQLLRDALAPAPEA